MSTKGPLVSVIVPTRNSEATLEACLGSIKAQSYASIELIVVDNYSEDTTRSIARAYTRRVFQRGPERCSQRNFGAAKASGEYVVFIDSDMRLSRDVIRQCVEAARLRNVSGVIIPEQSFGQGFWAACKRLERSFYIGVPWMEAARFFPKEIFERIDGYDEQLVSGEDWDLSQRAETCGRLARIDGYIFHNEGRLSLSSTLRKKYYYAQKFALYTEKTASNNLQQQIGIKARYGLFFSRPLKLLRRPHIGLGMLFMKTCEFAFGGFGFIAVRMQRRDRETS